MVTRTSTDVDEIQGRVGEDDTLQDPASDISGGVTVAVGDVSSFSVFLETKGAINVTFEFSPDGGDTWYEPSAESPVKFSGAGRDIVHVEYNVTHVRLTGSDTTGVRAQLREVV